MKKAKDSNVDGLPDVIFENGTELNQNQHASAFANFFSEKVNSIVNQTQTNPNMYNGKKVNVPNKFFMSSSDINDCLKTIKTKNCEGYDRIPPKILSDDASSLLLPLTGLFKRIYEQKTIPEQWSIAKVIPIYKKGLKNNIENYRPMANLCSSSKNL